MGAMQDDTLAKDDLREHERLKSARAPWESTWREIDDLFPNGAGGFNRTTQGQIRGTDLYDTTHLTALKRFKAAMVYITTPEHQQYIMPRFADPDLMKDRGVKLWCEEVGRRMYAMRYVNPSGFGIATDECWDQLGRYGPSPFWTDSDAEGMIFRTLHLSECYIDVDWAGRVDRAHRCFMRSARQLEGMFGLENLTPKMRKQLEQGGNPDTEFEIVHIVAPNTVWDGEKFDWRRMPIASRYLAVDEKLYLRRGGFYSMPISVGRVATSPNEIYGRSPAIDQLPTIHGLQRMRQDVLRAGQKMVNPALVFFDDDGITSVSTKPGGLNAGLMSEDGRMLVGRMPGGEQGIPYAMEMVEQERQTVKTDFSEEFFKILLDPNSRMTTVEVMEVIAKQGALVRPFAARYRDEIQTPVSQRQMELALRAGQLPELPPIVREAGAYPIVDYENPLAAMAKAEQTSKTLRFVEYATAVTSLAESPAADALDIDQMLQGGAEEIGVSPKYVRDAEMIAAIRGKRADDEAAAANVEQLQGGASAFLDIAKGNQIADGI
jgi:Bacteriophage head to tail connecting protein